MRCLCFSVLFVLSSLGAVEARGVNAAPLSLKARVVPQAVKLGEPFALEVTVTHQPQQRYELVPPGDLGDFEYLRQRRKREDGAETSTTVIALELSAFALGMQKTPAFSLEVVTAQAVSRVAVPQVPIEIRSILPKAAGQKLFGVKAPEGVTVRSWRLLYGLLALVCVAVASWALIRWLRHRKSTRPVVLPPPLPLEVRSMQALDGLARENLPMRAMHQAFYFRLSEIVRAYLGERYAFEALESTTPELLDALRVRHTPGLEMEAFAAFVKQSDFLRYAKAVATPDECKAHLELAYNLIQSTTAAQLPPPLSSSS